MGKKFSPVFSVCWFPNGLCHDSGCLFIGNQALYNMPKVLDIIFGDPLPEEKDHVRPRAQRHDLVGCPIQLLSQGDSDCRPQRLAQRPH